MEQKEIKMISLKYRWKTSVKKISKVQEDAKGNSFVMETCILDVCVCVWRCIKLREVILDKIDKVVQFLIPYRNIMASVLDSGITRLVVPLQVQ